MAPDPDQDATETNLRAAIEAYLKARAPQAPIEDMTDDAMGAIVEAMHEGWGVDLSQGAA
jgi:hypothetical protein